MPKSKRDMSPTALPGFEDTIVPARPGEQDMTDEKAYTGEVLFKRHPDVFRAVAAAFFIDGLSIRAVAARFRVSVNTVRTIRDMALESRHNTDAERAALFIKSKADKLHGIIQLRSLEAIYDRLSDPKKAAEVPIDTLVKLASITPDDKRKDIPASGEVIDIDEFDDVINGLDREKKSARGEADEMPENCSTANENILSRSVELNNVPQENKGNNETLCNSLCNGAEIGAPEADMPPKTPVPRGGGGTPGAARDGGLN